MQLIDPPANVYSVVNQSSVSVLILRFPLLSQKRRLNMTRFGIRGTISDEIRWKLGFGGFEDLPLRHW